MLSQQLKRDPYVLIADGIASRTERQHLGTAEDLRPQTADATAKLCHAIH
jgi:hypothetical protein